MMLYIKVGHNIIHREENAPRVGRVFLDEKSIKNVYALKNLIEKGREKFELKYKDVFVVDVG